MDYVKEAEEYLKSYPELKESLDNIRLELEHIENQLIGVKAISYDGMPGGSISNADDKLVNILFRKQKAEQALEETQGEVKLIENILDQLSEEDRKVLQAFYIEGLRGEALEKRLQICERQVYNLRHPIIRKFAKLKFGIKAIGK